MSAIVIDDHPLTITATRNLSIKNDIKILAKLTEGRNIVQRVETSKLDIVTIDVDIPGVSGIQVLEALGKHQYSGIIIIVSVENDYSYGKHCAGAGVNGFMSKKEGINNIVAAIEVAENDYCYFSFSFNRSVGSLTSDQQKFDSLSKQETSVMRYILNDKDNNDITEGTFVSNKTVSTYKSHLMEKLGCKSLMDLYTFT